MGVVVGRPGQRVSPVYRRGSHRSIFAVKNGPVSVWQQKPFIESSRRAPTAYPFRQGRAANPHRPPPEEYINSLCRLLCAREPSNSITLCYDAFENLQWKLPEWVSRRPPPPLSPPPRDALSIRLGSKDLLRPVVRFYSLGTYPGTKINIYTHVDNGH